MSKELPPMGWLQGNQPPPSGWLGARYIPAANGPDPAVLGNFSACGHEADIACLEREIKELHEVASLLGMMIHSLLADNTEDWPPDDWTDFDDFDLFGTNGSSHPPG